MSPLLRQAPLRRLLLFALLAEIAFAVLNVSTMPVYLKFDRGLGTPVIALVLIGFLLSEALFKTYMGALADRWGPRLLLCWAPALAAISAGLTLLIPKHMGSAEIALLVGLRMVDGLAAAMLWPAAFALMGDLVEDQHRQQALSLLNMMYLLGIALAFPIGGAANDIWGAALADSLGSRSPGLLLAGLTFLMAMVMGMVGLPQLPHRQIPGQTQMGASATDLWACIRRIPAYLSLSFITFMGVGFPMPIFKLFAEQQFGLSESKIGALVFPAALAMATLSLPMSRWGDRMGRPRAIRTGLGLCTAGMALIALGAFVPSLRSPWVVAVGGPAVGVGFLLTIPAWLAAVSEINPARRGIHLGAVMTAQGFGAIVGAPLGGWAYEGLAPLGVALGLGEPFARYGPFLGCAICLSLGWLLSFRLFKPIGTQPLP